MQAPSNAQSRNEAPLYVRWGSDGSEYAIELKLELVGKIRTALAEHSSRKFEIGGVLVGSLPSPYSPTLRIEDVEFISRDERDGPTFLIDPSQENKVADVRRKAREIGRSVVGLFRSHLRPGALGPSLADRSLISGFFSESVCALLLVEANEPFSAAFFVAKDRRLPAEPSLRQFKFDEQEFKRLPELEPELAPSRLASPDRSKQRKTKYVAMGLGVAVGALVLFLVLNQWQFALPVTLPFLGPNQLDLTVTREGPGLRISWNHSSRDFDHASGALLRLKTSSRVRSIRIGLDELRLGAVEVENDAPRVEVTLALEAPGSASVSQSVTWGLP